MQRHAHSATRRALLSVACATLLVLSGVINATEADAAVPFEVQRLDGTGNNVANPAWGKAGTAYSRVGPTRYADGVSAPRTGPNTRFISNRVFNDVNQNIFSERRITQWAFTWGQFVDHTIGLRDSAGPTATAANIPFNSNDPLESFTNTLGNIAFSRSAATAGTGTSTNNPRQQSNTVSSYLDAWAVYGGTDQRLEWLREGPVDGNLANNSARLLMPGAYLPRRTSRGNAATAPAMDADGRLAATPNNAMVAGDVRANENIALTATQTLFAREHNRIVSLLPASLSEEDKFQIARRVVIAEQQYVTYNEFLPAVGVTLPAYTGYKSGVNANLSNEFATVGYRAHSQIHGEIELETDADRYTAAQVQALEAQGIEVAIEDGEAEITIPLNVAFFNPDLVPSLQLGPLLQAIGLESEYRNDEQIDNQLRSVLFQVPVAGNPGCLDGPTLPQCFRGVVDLGAIDTERARDHGLPSYNELRQAYGLAPRTSFTAITGEATDAFPADPVLTPGNEINDPDSLTHTQLFDIDGAPLPVGDEAVVGTRSVRRTTTASRLRAIYGNVNNVDAFVGMVAERHVPGTEFGELQLAIWTKQFQALRDGDRFFYRNIAGLDTIKQQYGIDYRRTLGQIIAANTDIPAAELNDNVFLVSDAELPPTTCKIDYTVATSWPGNFQVALNITNLGTAPTQGWTLRWRFPNGQAVTQLWNGVVAQSGVNATVTNASWNAVIPPGGTLTGVGFNATWDDATNAEPPDFTLNNARCARG
ncbi:peroxidase family protein [Nonomuraea sp. NEAU-A123]|uniref:peroxidase family protein n=1 Tax=Nonomuraea sp. NEAU-A123 TaxID=2839649 RepID=UPI001BE477A3|nr:peroxidase family protein [Nonomuraea sp. NEAU-A123]MBT2232160.1 cellulose binding domain-containing protein [Nonomuraea sp. NEAU-A123]